MSSSGPLDGRRFAQVRSRVFPKLVAPHGFSGKGAKYVRHKGNQLHGILFQGNKFGGDFTINLGLSYDFTPPCWNYDDRPYEKYEDFDYGLNTRIGCFIGGDKWWPYGRDAEQCEEILRSVSKTCIAIFEKTEGNFADPLLLLEILNPKVMEGEVLRIIERRQDENGQDNEYGNLLAKLFPGSGYPCKCLFIMLIHTALKYGQIEKAKEYLKWADRAVTDHPKYEAHLRALKRKLGMTTQDTVKSKSKPKDAEGKT